MIKEYWKQMLGRIKGRHIITESGEELIILNPIHCRIVHRPYLHHYPLPSGPNNNWRYRNCNKCTTFRYLLCDRIFNWYKIKNKLPWNKVSCLGD